MENLNVILKSFDGDPTEKALLEAAFHGMQLGTCISIANEPSVLPNIMAKDHRWMSAGNLRAGRYPDLDWNTIAPLDEEIIEKMRHYEAMCLTMLDRYTFPFDIPYGERKRQYLAHLRYWNHALDAESIDLFLLNHVPHQCYDYVIYGLCKLKGIPTLYVERCWPTDTMYMVQDWEASSSEVRDRILTLQREYRDTARTVPLSQNFEYYYEYFRKPRPTPWYKPNDNRDYYRSFFGLWGARAARLLFTQPKRLLAALSSPESWRRKLRDHRTFRLYERNVKVPDLSVPYIYVPLHFQPEATTNPMAGAFVDQERISQMIASCLPPGVKLYIKEHPRQGERCRSEAFYQALLDLPAVTFVPKSMETYQLIDRAIAVATAVGTVTFEAIVRAKPVLMFGHFLYQYAPGVFRIRTTQDCRDALGKILRHEASPGEREVRLFLKALEDCGTPSAGLPAISPYEKRSDAEKARLMGERVAKSIRALEKPRR